MKRIEDIERMSLEDLMEIADDSSVKAADGLTEKISEGISATEIMRDGRNRARFAAGAVSIAVAAGLAILLALPHQPKDTFDDPALAYAELEKTFAYISGKIDRGLDIVEEASPALERPSEVINKINNR